MHRIHTLTTHPLVANLHCYRRRCDHAKIKANDSGDRQEIVTGGTSVRRVASSRLPNGFSGSTLHKNLDRVRRAITTLSSEIKQRNPRVSNAEGFHVLHRIPRIGLKILFSTPVVWQETSVTVFDYANDYWRGPIQYCFSFLVPLLQSRF